MDNSEKIILDLCGGTGAWSKPYRDAGYDVQVITLPEYDVTFSSTSGVKKNSIYFPSRTGKKDLHVQIEKIYGILAAPPCTEFSKAKTTSPRDFQKGMETIEACMQIIWGVQKIHKLAFWALENPEGLLRRFLGNPPYHFYQWYFGDCNRNKPTDLWGRFNEPKRKHMIKPEYVVKSAHNKNADWYSNSSAKTRAITPKGFAEAFYKANK